RHPSAASSHRNRAIRQTAGGTSGGDRTLAVDDAWQWSPRCRGSGPPFQRQSLPIIGLLLASGKRTVLAAASGPHPCATMRHATLAKSSSVVGRGGMPRRCVRFSPDESGPAPIFAAYGARHV